MERLKNDLELQKEGLITDYENKYAALERELTLKLKCEVHEIEERKNEHRNDLLENHCKSFREMKDYYNQITVSYTHLTLPTTPYV